MLEQSLSDNIESIKIYLQARARDANIQNKPENLITDKSINSYSKIL
jgi:hypothetical protein